MGRYRLAGGRGRGLGVALVLSGRRGPRPCRAAGLSLVEVLVAAALFLVVVIGVLPLFTRAMGANVSGNEATQGSAFARSQIEEFLQLPFNSANLAPTDGNPIRHYYSAASRAWVAGAPPADGSDRALWTREVRVRQYHVSALADGRIEETEALAAGSDAAWVHLKEITVELKGERETEAMGPAQSFTFQVFKAQ